MALGAPQSDIYWLVLVDAGRLVLIAIGLGLILALSLTELMSRLLHGIGQRDPLTLAAVPLILFFIALCTSYVLAWRAARVDQIIALRYD